jgi:hypothetical protein
MTTDYFTNVLVAAGLFFFAGLFDAIVGVLSDPIRYETSIFRRFPQSYFLKQRAESNRFRRYPTGEPVVKYFNRRNKPIYFERFPGSTTFLSWLCDAPSLFVLFSNLSVAFAAAWLSGTSGAEFWFLALVFRLIHAITRHSWTDLITWK